MGSRLIAILAVLSLLMLCGCSGDSGAGGGNTNDARADVKKSADYGGAEPSPDLPKPIGAGGPGPTKPSDKFKPAGGG